MSNKSLAQAADAWKPVDQFTNTTTGLDTDLLQSEPLTALGRTFQLPCHFGPKPANPSFRFTDYVALLLEQLARNPASRSDALRGWLLYDTLVWLPLTPREARQISPFFPDAAAPGPAEAARFKSWVDALLADTEDPLVRLFAAGRTSSEPAEKYLIATSRLDVPLGGLAGLFYAGRLPFPLLPLATQSVHGTWLEGWGGRLKPRQQAFVEKCFVTPPVTDRIAGNGAHALKWSSYRYSEVLGSDFLVAGTMIAPDAKRFSGAFTQAFVKGLFAELAETIIEQDREGEDMPADAVQLELKRYYRQIGAHLTAEQIAVLDTWTLKKDFSRELRESLREGSQEFKTPYVSGKELDQIVADRNKFTAEQAGKK